jgi:predicted lysophospholipase L1 biosynthesis ABC-type transport system permease subunit
VAAHVQDAIDEVSALLTQTHRGVEDFTFDTRQELAESIENTARSTRLTGSLIAGISLIVGGIGLTERIREIGVRRAVGAKARHIFTQILVESTVGGILGGILGLAAALGMTHPIKFTTDSASLPVFQTASVILSFAFAVLIGIYGVGRRFTFTSRGIAHHVRRSLHCPHFLSAGVLRVQLRPSAARRRQAHLRLTPMRPESPNHALQRL